ncbi:MAG TPA: hypothetical protein VNQ77_17450 [Frankiaceae bacterium]|nr:hypothetical protein [Frankiaceae bacterium]
MEPLTLRDDAVPDLLVVVRLGSVTLADDALHKSVSECHARWGIWGFSVLEVPLGDYELLARLRPIITTRRLLLVAEGRALLDAGFPLLPTLDHPHWTVVLASPSPDQFAAVRRVFHGPIENPAWTGRG